MYTWTLENGEKIDLVTQEEFDALPMGTELTCINNKKVVKGKDYIDNDTRFGYLAYGISQKTND